MNAKISLERVEQPTTSIYTAYLGHRAKDVEVKNRTRIDQIFNEIKSEALQGQSLGAGTHVTVDYTMKQVILHGGAGDVYVQTTAKIARLIEEGNTILQPLLKAQQLAVAENLDHRSLSETPFAPDKTSLYTPPTGTPSERIQAARQLLEPLYDKLDAYQKERFLQKMDKLIQSAKALQTAVSTSNDLVSERSTVSTVDDAINAKQREILEKQEKIAEFKAEILRTGGDLGHLAQDQQQQLNSLESDLDKFKRELTALETARETNIDYAEAKAAILDYETRLAIKQDLESTDYFLLLAGLLFTDDKGNPNASVDEIAKQLKDLEKPLRKSRSMMKGLEVAITSFSSGYTEERFKDLAIAIAAARETSKLKRMSLALEHYGELRQDSLAATTLMAITHSAIKFPSPRSLSPQTIRECSIDDRISDKLLTQVVDKIKEQQPQPIAKKAAPPATDAGAADAGAADAGAADAEEAKEDE